MAIAPDLLTKQNNSLIESTSTANQVGMVVVNPDGSDVGATVSVTADTEFSAAAALADATANPTTTHVGSMLHTFNGTTWDRALSGAGNVGDGVLRATLAADDPAVALLTTIDADTSKIPSLGTAVMAASAPVTIATDDTVMTAIQTAVELIDDAISGSEMQVDVVAALPAGTNAIGKLAANSGVDIGDVDVLSIVPGTGATNLGKAVDTAAGATDTVVAMGAIRDDALTTLTPVDGDYVNLRVDSTGALWVTSRGGATHDSAVITTGDQSMLEAKDFDGSALPNAVGTEGDAVRASGSLSGVQYVMCVNEDGSAVGTVTETNSAAILADTANMDTNLASALTALQIMDDWDDGDFAKTVLGATATDNGPDPYWDADGDNTAQALKAGAGNLYKVTVHNPNGTKAYVQFFDTAAGSVTVGTTTPVYVLPVPANGSVIDDHNPGLSFGTAITYACTTTATGNGDPTTGLEVSATFK